MSTKQDLNASVLQYQAVDSLTTYLPNDAFVITAQREMAKKLRTVNTGRRVRAHDLNTILKETLTDWYSEHREFLQYIAVTEWIDKEMVTTNNALLSSFKHNAKELLSSVRTLIEIGVKTQELPKTTEEERCFAQLYKAFCANEKCGLKTLFEELKSWNDLEKFQSVILARYAFMHASLPLRKEHLHTIYFQGFYYFHPLQSRFIEKARRLGIRVVYLVPFESDCPKEYEIWTKNPRYIGLPVAQMPDQKTLIPSSATCRVIRYADVFSMASGLRKFKEDYEKEYPATKDGLDGYQPIDHRLCAPMTMEVREILNTFFAEDITRSSLLAVPPGRYLWGLYRMWDKQTRQVNLEAETVRECLATGWAGKNSSQALAYFNQVEHYFHDCKTTAQWKARIDLLLLAHKHVLPLFKTDVAKTNDNERWERIISSPFATIGAFRLPKAHLRVLCDSLKQIIDDATLLFKDMGDEVDLNHHFARLRQVLKEKHKQGEVLEEERQILDIFQKRLSFGANDIGQCSSGLLQDAMGFFLGGKKKDENLTQEIISPFGDVRDVGDIEASLLAPMDKTLHWCYCNASFMPGKQLSLSWPLNDLYMASIDVKGETCARLEDRLYSLKHPWLMYRYLFHIAKRHPDLILSYVQNLNDKELLPSIFVTLCLDEQKRAFERQYGTDKPFESPLQFEDGFFSHLKKNPPWAPQKPTMQKALTATVEQYFVKTKTWPLDVRLAIMDCPRKSWRVFYDYVIGEGPVFSSDFHLKHLFPKLTSMLKHQLKLNSFNEVHDELMMLYPAFNRSERFELLDWSPFFPVGKSQGAHGEPEQHKDKYDSGCTDYRVYLKYLNKKRVDGMMKRYWGDIESKHGTTNNLRPCTLCPHRSYCFAFNSNGVES